ncbi:MAG TPA: YfhO family protein, partial [bacterium]|nr:YfhO family protein [bacterium]
AVPFQMLHPIPNLFQQPEMIKEAAQIRQTTGNKRMLSLTQTSQMSYSGLDSFEKSITGPASNFLTNSNSAWNFRSADYYLSVWVKSSQNLQLYANKGFPYQGDLLDVAGVGLFMLPQELLSPKYETIGKWQDDFLILNHEASTDLRWAEQHADLPDAPSILNILASPHSGWRQKVYLEKNTAGNYCLLTPVKRSIPITLHENNLHSNSLVISNHSYAGPGYVVFNENFAPGWHAWVDGAPQPILRADGLFMAVALSVGGPHQVVFRYEPASFRFGLFISLVSLSLLVFGVSVRRRED